jgi:hypothetical protein
MVLARFAAIVGIGAAFVLPGTSAFAAKEDKLGADWWQWALSAPTAHNPLLDTTGADCAVGQHGNLWFLAGVFGGGTVTRSCTIPKNKNIFFPLANQVNFNTPNVCGQDGNDIPVDTLRAGSAAFADGVIHLSAELDGQALTDIERLQSKVFTVTLPEDNVFDAVCIGLGLGDVPGDKYKPAVDDGFYLQLDRLSPGSHTLHFHAENPSQGFAVDVTYHLTVAS